MDIVNSVGGTSLTDSRFSWGKIESLPMESSYSSKMPIVYLDFVVRLSIFLPFRNCAIEGLSQSVLSLNRLYILLTFPGANARWLSLF
jgi:hypothetical protein